MTEDNLDSDLEILVKANQTLIDAGVTDEASRRKVIDSITEYKGIYQTEILFEANQILMDLGINGELSRRKMIDKIWLKYFRKANETLIDAGVTDNTSRRRVIDSMSGYMGSVYERLNFEREVKKANSKVISGIYTIVDKIKEFYNTFFTERY